MFDESSAYYMGVVLISEGKITPANEGWAGHFGGMRVFKDLGTVQTAGATAYLSRN